MASAAFTSSTVADFTFSMRPKFLWSKTNSKPEGRTSTFLSVNVVQIADWVVKQALALLAVIASAVLVWSQSRESLRVCKKKNRRSTCRFPVFFSKSIFSWCGLANSMPPSSSFPFVLFNLGYFFAFSSLFKSYRRIKALIDRYLNWWYSRGTWTCFLLVIIEIPSSSFEIGYTCGFLENCQHSRIEPIKRWNYTFSGMIVVKKRIEQSVFCQFRHNREKELSETQKRRKSMNSLSKPFLTLCFSTTSCRFFVELQSLF